MGNLRLSFSSYAQYSVPSICVAGVVIIKIGERVLICVDIDPSYNISPTLL